jgi:hypothetical protein
MAGRRNSTAAAAIEHLRRVGLGYPGAHLKSPWPGHLDLAVRDKTFAYLSAPGDACSFSCKLPYSAAIALAHAGFSPTGYGLGKSGWVTWTEADGDLPPQPLLEEWLEESYRAQAPKKLAALLGAGGAGKPGVEVLPTSRAGGSARAPRARRSGTAATSRTGAKASRARKA